MAKVTQRAAIVAYFQAKAEMEKDLASRSRKYVVYKSAATGARFYIGKAGALRKGRTVAESIPVNEQIRQGVIRQGTKILESMG